MSKIIFITGTDTGVGKTLMTAFLLHHLRRKNVRALAMKPFCSGGIGDVEILQRIQRGELSDAEMNPYYFPEPLAPFIAAKLSRHKIGLSDVLKKISNVKKRCDVLLIEGAGGLMVPLGNDFMVQDLITSLRCSVVVVSRNQLGTINHTLLTINALQAPNRKKIAVALVDPKSYDDSALFNRKFLEKSCYPTSVFSIPFLRNHSFAPRAFEKNYQKLKKTLAAILECV